MAALRAVERQRQLAGRFPRPGPGRESVWDDPRPPRVVPVTRSARVVFAGAEL